MGLRWVSDMTRFRKRQTNFRRIKIGLGEKTSSGRRQSGLGNENWVPEKIRFGRRELGLGEKNKIWERKTRFGRSKLGQRKGN